ncbi:MAG: amino acid dehydrogenase [Opitutae bacterium]|nr:amino acid dehydrogenase [Opitutae bacterium]
MKDSTVIVVGGGVIGAACAHYLVKAGRKVTLIEKDLFGHACSLHNCGYVCPSHALPLTEPGAVGTAIRGMFKSNSPFSVKWRLDPKLALWFFRFARRCNKKDMLQGGKAIHPLLVSSLKLWKEIIHKDKLSCEWKSKGLLYAYASKKAFEAFAATDELLRHHFNESATRHEGDALQELEPALKPGLAGGWHYEGDAHLRSDLLMASWKQNLESKGVEIHEKCTLTGIIENPDSSVTVSTDRNLFEGSHLVIATGAVTPHLREELGWRAPIQPGKGYSITMPRPRICPEIPVIFPETKVGVTPFESGYRLGSTMEFAGYDDSLNPKRYGLLLKGAEDYLQEPHCEPIENIWYGWRPMTHDSIPIIGPCPGRKNVILATGHNMLGLSMAPGTGKLVTEMITGSKPHLEPAPYSPERF